MEMLNKQLKRFRKLVLGHKKSLCDGVSLSVVSSNTTTVSPRVYRRAVVLLETVKHTAKTWVQASRDDHWRERIIIRDN